MTLSGREITSSAKIAGLGSFESQLIPPGLTFEDSRPKRLSMALPTISKALELHQTGRLAEASALYQEILAVQPENVDALQLLGVANHQLGDSQSAVVHLQRAIQINPLPGYFNNLGHALLSLGQTDDAVEAFQSATARAPDDANIRSNLGIAFVRSGRMQEALSAFELAVAIDPDCPEAQNNLGSFLLDVGDAEHAESYLRRALELRPGYEEATVGLARIAAIRASASI